MSHLYLIVRICGVLLALFLLMGTYITVSGLLYSEEVPPLYDRVLSALPGALLSLLLLLPQSLFLRGIPYKLIAAAYMLAILTLLYVVFRDLWNYLSGLRHWMIVPTSIAVLSIVLCNGLVLYAQRRRLPPNNSFKPTPLRGAA